MLAIFFAMNNKHTSCIFLSHKGDIVDSLKDLDDLIINSHDNFSPQNIDISITYVPVMEHQNVA
jgi:hypothetical protein